MSAKPKTPTLEEMYALIQALQAENKELREKQVRKDMSGFLRRNPDAGRMGPKGPVPDMFGYCTIGGTEYRVACWDKGGELQLQFNVPDKK